MRFGRNMAFFVEIIFLEGKNRKEANAFNKLKISYL